MLIKRGQEKWQILLAVDHHPYIWTSRPWLVGEWNQAKEILWLFRLICLPRIWQERNSIIFVAVAHPSQAHDCWMYFILVICSGKENNASWTTYYIPSARAIWKDSNLTGSVVATYSSSKWRNQTRSSLQRNRTNITQSDVAVEMRETDPHHTNPNQADLRTDRLQIDETDSSIPKPSETGSERQRSRNVQHGWI